MKNIVTIILAVAICCMLNAPALAKQDAGEGAEDVISFYYKNPSPDKIPQALSDFLKSDFFKSDEFEKNNHAYLTSYTYGRIAQLESSLIEKYESIFEKASHDGRLFMLKVFQICGNDQVREFLASKLKDSKFRKEKKDISKILEEGIPIAYNPLKKEPQCPDDLDMLWTEFLVTGNEEVVKKIIGVLEWPERLRPNLQEFLRSSAPSEQKEKIAAILKEEYNITCNVNTADIASNTDLDTRIFGNAIRAKNTDWDKFNVLRQALGLSDEDIVYMANKGSVDWSLTSNAEQHEKVFEICVNEIGKRTGTAKLTLLQIGSHGYMSRDDNEKAIELVKQLASLDPRDAGVHYVLGSMYVTTGDMENALQELDILRAMDMSLAKDLEKEVNYGQLHALTEGRLMKKEDIGASEELVSKIVDACNNVRSFQSRFTIKDYANKKLKSKEYTFIEWRFGHEKPDRFSVEQYANEDTGSVYDMWTSYDGRHYDLLPVLGWIEEKDPDLIKHKEEMGYILSLKKYADLIRQNEPASVSISGEGNNKYIMIEYVSPSWDFSIFKEGETLREVDIYVIENSSLPAKASIKLSLHNTKTGEDGDLEYIQTFTNYDNVTIDRPRKVYENEKSEFMTPEELQKITGKW